MRALFGFVWRAVLATLAALVGLSVGGALASTAGLAVPAVPSVADPGAPATMGLLGCAALAFGLAPLAAGLEVGLVGRWAILAALVYVCLGINTAIESAIFTTFGGAAGMLAFNLVLAVVLTGALAALFRPRG